MVDLASLMKKPELKLAQPGDVKLTKSILCDNCGKIQTDDDLDFKQDFGLTFCVYCYDHRYDPPEEPKSPKKRTVKVRETPKSVLSHTPNYEKPSNESILLDQAKMLEEKNAEIEMLKGNISERDRMFRALQQDNDEKNTRIVAYQQQWADIQANAVRFNPNDSVRAKIELEVLIRRINGYKMTGKISILRDLRAVLELL